LSATKEVRRVKGQTLSSRACLHKTLVEKQRSGMKKKTKQKRSICELYTLT